MPLIANGEVVGVGLRTKSRTNPLIISIGHRITLETAVDYVLSCCRGYRLPEPTRQAHNTASGKLPTIVKSEESSQHPHLHTLWEDP